MATKFRAIDRGSRDDTVAVGVSGIATVKDLATRRVVQNGVESIGGAARLAIAAVRDLLDGKLTPQEATVVNTTSGRILKAAELHLKYYRSGNEPIGIPE